MRRSRVIHKLRQNFRYRFNRMISRGTAVHYVVLALVAFGVVLLGINAYFFGLFSPAALDAEGIDNDLGGGFLDSLWWSAKHVVDPGAFAEDYGAPWPVLAISLALSVIGLSLLGIFIGFVTTSVQGRLEQLRKGRTEVMEGGHTLVLGWSNKIGSVLGFLNRLKTEVVRKAWNNRIQSKKRFHRNGHRHPHPHPFRRDPECRDHSQEKRIYQAGVIVRG